MNNTTSVNESANPAKRLGQSLQTALLQLQRLGRSRTTGTSDDAWIHSLVWLTAARLALRAGDGSAASIDSLMEFRAWQQLGLPQAALKVVWPDTAKATASHARDLSEAAWIVSQLRGLEGEIWSVSDFIEPNRKRAGRGPAAYVYKKATAELLVNALNITPTSRVWVPFDPSGQLTLGVLKAGPMAVLAQGPLSDDPHVRLQIELFMQLEDVDGRGVLEPEDTEDPRRTFEVFTPNKVLVTPPLGTAKPNHHWRTYSLPGSGDIPFAPGAIGADAQATESERAEIWVLQHMWGARLHRGVFVLPPSLFFAKGRERKVREALVLSPTGKSVDAVVTLARTEIPNLTISPNLMILSNERSTNDHGEYIRMVDMNEPEFGPGSAVVLRCRPDIDQTPFGSGLYGASVDIHVQELDAVDISLQPSRYLRRVLDLKGERIPLGNLVKLVRAPNASKDVASVRAWEIGIPQLKGWQPITGPFDSALFRSTQVSVRRSEEVELAEGDLVVSVKGTIGKVALLGRPSLDGHQDGAPKARHDCGPALVVAAQSCVALRLKPYGTHGVTPESLLQYLRSDDCQSQLAALRKGSTVEHISPEVMLKSVMIPVPENWPVDELNERYEQLASLDAKVRSAEQEIQKIVSSPSPFHACGIQH